MASRVFCVRITRLCEVQVHYLVRHSLQCSQIIMITASKLKIRFVKPKLDSNGSMQFTQQCSISSSHDMHSKSKWYMGSVLRVRWTVENWRQFEGLSLWSRNSTPTARRNTFHAYFLWRRWAFWATSVHEDDQRSVTHVTYALKRTRFCCYQCPPLRWVFAVDGGKLHFCDWNSPPTARRSVHSLRTK